MPAAKPKKCVEHPSLARDEHGNYFCGTCGHSRSPLPQWKCPLCGDFRTYDLARRGHRACLACDGTYQAAIA